MFPQPLVLLEQAGEVEQLFGEDQGLIRLAASSSIANYLLPEKMANFQQNLLGTPIELYIGNNEQVIEASAGSVHISG